MRVVLLVLILVVGVLIAGLLTVVLTSNGEGELGSSATSRPDRFVLVQDGSEVVIVDGAEQQVMWNLDLSFAAGNELRIESIEVAGENQVLVGTCCEPADGRQLVLDTDTGRVEFFPLTFRFPSVNSTFDLVVSGGCSIEVENLGAFLAYEDGVGVVAPGPTLREAEGNEALQPVLLPNERVAFVEAETLTVVDFDGLVLAETSANGVVALEFDARNNVLVAAVEGASGEVDGLQLFSPDDLEATDHRVLDQSITSFDIADGWLLLSNADASLSASRIDDPNTPPEVLIEAGAGVASWLPSRTVETRTTETEAG